MTQTSITCQITQLKADQLRLTAPSSAEQPETLQFLVQFLLALPGVTGIDIQPASESITIRHVGTTAARAAILQALRGAPACSETDSIDAHPLAQGRQAGEPPYTKCELSHAMRGRVRLRIPVLSAQATLAGVLAQFLAEQPGIRQVRLNQRAANVVVTFDPASLDAEAIMALVIAYNPDSTAIANWQAAQCARRPVSNLHGRRHKWEGALAAGALMLTLFAGAPLVWLVYALLLGSAGSILQRTYKGLFKDRRLTVEALCAVIMLLLMASGVLWLAALLPILLVSAPQLRTWVQRAPKAGSKSVATALAGVAIRQAVRAATVAPQATPATDASHAATNVVQEVDPLFIPELALTAESLQLGQTIPGVGALSNTTSSSDAAWVTHAYSFRVSRKANG